MKLENITLLSLGSFKRPWLENVVSGVEREFLLPTVSTEAYFDHSPFYDPSRNQYNGNELIKEIDARYSSDKTKTIAIFNVDLYIPILTYIFGQAFLNGKSGIVSLVRLSNVRYGLRENEELFADRIEKEIIHELGHMFGLIHCHRPECVMRSSTYVEDIDQKTARLCPNCREKLFFKK